MYDWHAGFDNVAEKIEKLEKTLHHIDIVSLMGGSEWITVCGVICFPGIARVDNVSEGHPQEPPASDCGNFICMWSSDL